MALNEPTSMEDLLYFTNRTLENGGWAKAWVYRPEAPSGKGKLGKPKDPKTGKTKVRSTVYVDDDGNEYPKSEIDPTLLLEIKYRSPFTGEEGETTVPFKRKKYKGVDAFVFEDAQGNKIPITKKLKEIKKK
ncbi:MAG: hypothetical protein ACMXYF_02060 [Candidatus Woesearchaeota archaeon]